MRPLHPSLDLPELDHSAAWSIVREPVDAVTPVGQGTRSRVYRVELTEGGSRIVRLTPRQHGRVAREAWVRARMGGAVPVVHAVAVQHVPIAQQVDVVVMNELPGVTLDVALSRSPEALAASLWNEFGAGLAAFHAVTVTGFGLLDGAGKGAWATWREAVTAIAHSAVEEARATPLADLCDRAEAALAELAPALDAIHSPHLLHGDAHPRNVLVHRDKIRAWFDFEYAMGGDPLYELAYVAPNFEETPAASLAPALRLRRQEAFIEGYTDRLATVTGDPHRLRCYRLIHALRGAEFLRVTGGGATPDERAESVRRVRDAIERWLQSPITVRSAVAS